MKRILLLVVMVTALLLASCGDNNPSQKGDTSTEALKNAVDSLLSINSFYYTHHDEQILNIGENTSTNIMTSETKRVNEPLAMWTRQKTTNTYSDRDMEDTEGIMETYQRVTGNGWALSYKGGNTGWHENLIDDEEQVEKFIENIKNGMRASQYLLNANLDSFKMEGKENGQIKYVGEISRISIVEAYKLYVRDFYVYGQLIKQGEGLSNEELLAEITGGEIDVLTVGMPSLAFSAEPIPVTVWVDENDNVITKVQIDKIKATQAMVNMIFEDREDPVPKVEKSMEIYELVEFNTFDEIPMPE